MNLSLRAQKIRATKRTPVTWKNVAKTLDEKNWDALNGDFDSSRPMNRFVLEQRWWTLCMDVFKDSNQIKVQINPVTTNQAIEIKYIEQLRSLDACNFPTQDIIQSLEEDWS